MNRNHRPTPPFFKLYSLIALLFICDLLGFSLVPVSLFFLSGLVLGSLSMAVHLGLALILSAQLMFGSACSFRDNLRALRPFLRRLRMLHQIERGRR